MATYPFRNKRKAETFDPSTLEDEIRATMTPRANIADAVLADEVGGLREWGNGYGADDTSPIGFAPPAVRMAAMLEQPQITADDLGRITADAIKASHDATAEVLSALGNELSENIKRLDQVKINADETLKAILDLAQQYRDKGKADAELIEKTAKLNDEARAMVDTMRAKLA